MKGKLVKYGVFSTAMCDVGVVASSKGIVEIRLQCPLAAKLAGDIEKNGYYAVPYEKGDAIIEDAVGQLTEYFEGSRRKFDVPLDWRVGGFRKKVLGIVKRIPYGKTLTYGEVARRAGNADAARAVGGAVGANPLPLVVPCHRVIAAGNKPGGFGGGLELKAELLKLEGLDYGWDI